MSSPPLGATFLAVIATVLVQCSSSANYYDIDATDHSYTAGEDMGQLNLLATEASNEARRRQKMSTNTSSTSSTPGLRKGKSKKFAGLEVEDLMKRAEQYFEEGEFSIPMWTKHYGEQAAVLEKALSDARDKVFEQTGRILEVSDPYLKPYYMKEVQDYDFRRVADRGIERLKRVENLDITHEEFAALRKHFYNEKERDPDRKKAHRLSSMKWKFRRALEKDPDNEKILNLMRLRGWTMDDLKRNRLPSGPVVKDFIERYRQGRTVSDARDDSVMRGNRSNLEVDIDLNTDLDLDELGDAYQDDMYEDSTQHE